MQVAAASGVDVAEPNRKTGRCTVPVRRTVLAERIVVSVRNIVSVNRSPLWAT
jgi:hypothetical protein